MKSHITPLAVFLSVIVTGASTVSAGVVSRIVREVTGGRSGRAVRDGLESVAEKGARRGAREGGALVARASDDVAKPILASFGDDGARALASLSTPGAERLAAMSDDLITSGRAQDWLGLVAQHGDLAVDWLWERRGSVAVGTFTTAVLLRPEEFIQATEHLATTTINAAGEHVAGPIVGSAASAIPWTLLWLALIALAALWLVAKKSFGVFFHSLLSAVIQAVKSGQKSVAHGHAQDKQERA